MATTFYQTLSDQNNFYDTHVRACIVQLLPAGSTPCRPFVIGKSTSDANTVTLLPATGDNIAGASSLVLSSLGNVTIKPVPGGWTIISQSAVTSTGGGGAAPAAPNVTSPVGGYACAPTYQNVNGIPWVGMAGTVTAPTTDPNYAHLTEIDVYLWEPGATVRPSFPTGVLRAPFTLRSTNQLDWAIANIEPQPNAAAVYPRCEFVCINDANAQTASPYTTYSISVAGVSSVGLPTITSVNASYSADGSSFQLSGAFTAPSDPTFSYLEIGGYLYTTLAAAISSTGATSVQVASAAGYTINKSVIQVDAEQMLVTAIPDPTHVTVTRGYNSTTAATHSNGADVLGVSPDLVAYLADSLPGQLTWRGVKVTIPLSVAYQIWLQVYAVSAAGNPSSNYLAVTPASFSALNIVSPQNWVSTQLENSTFASLLANGAPVDWSAAPPTAGSWLTARVPITAALASVVALSTSPGGAGSSLTSGASCLEIVTNGTIAPSQGTGVFSNLVPCNPGQVFTATVASCGIAGILVLKYLQSDGVTIAGQQVASLAAGSSWVRQTNTLTAPTGASYVFIGIASSGAGNLFISNVVLSGAGQTLDSNGNQILTLTGSSFPAGMGPNYAGIFTDYQAPGSSLHTPTTSGSNTLWINTSIASINPTPPANSPTGPVGCVVTGPGVTPGTTVTAVGAFVGGSGFPVTLSQNASATTVINTGIYNFIPLPTLPSTTYTAPCVMLNSGQAPAHTYYIKTGVPPIGQAWVDQGDPGDLQAGIIATGVLMSGQGIFGALSSNTIVSASLITGVLTAAVAAVDVALSFNGSGFTMNVDNVNAVLLTAAAGGQIQLDPVNMRLYVSGSSGSITNQATVTNTAVSVTQSASGGYLQVNVSYNGIACVNNSGAFDFQLNKSTLQMSSLPSSSPGAGTKKFWYDPSDSNRVKFAA